MPGSSDRWSGESTCSFCLQLYVLELERCCGSCDRAICPLCVTAAREPGGVLCPPCASGAEAGEEA